MDQYYTQQYLINEIVDKIKKLISNLKSKNLSLSIVDFSAGDGRFGDCLIENKIISNNDNSDNNINLFEFDIDPKIRTERIIKQDWLKLTSFPKNIHKNIILTLNPPFGKSAITAYRFIDHALQLQNEIENIRIIAIYCIMPLVPIEFDGSKIHNIYLLKSNSFFILDNDNNKKDYTAPCCLHEVIAKPFSFLQLKVWTTTPNKPYHYDIRDKFDFVVRDILSLPFTNIKHELPIGIIRKNGFYAGMTALLIDKNSVSLILPDNNIQTKSFDIDCKPKDRPWVSKSNNNDKDKNKNRWKLISFSDDLDDNNNGCYRSGCGTLKIFSSKQGILCNKEKLENLLTKIVNYIKNNKETIQGGGRGPKNITIGTIYWIMNELNLN